MGQAGSILVLPAFACVARRIVVGDFSRRARGYDLGQLPTKLSFIHPASFRNELPCILLLQGGQRKTMEIR